MTVAALDPMALRGMLARDPIQALMSTLGSMHSIAVTSPAPGYFVGGLNSRKAVERMTIDDWPTVGDLDGIGVVDSPEQFIERFGSLIDSDPRTLAVFFARIDKSEQDPDGGWRWHKWGEYLGDKDPQHEYLYDEDDSIEAVYTFHIVELDPALI